jgi:hypothetical protein
MKKLIPFLSLPFLLFSCGGSAEPEAEVTEAENSVNITINDEQGGEVNVDLSEMEEAMSQLGESLNITINDEDGEPVEVMNFRDIKAIMPERLLGMDRTSHTGEKTGAFGISISQAEAKYRDEDRYLDVQVVDGGGAAIARLAGAAWASVEIDRETDDGYERTSTIDGYKAFEKYNSQSQRGEIQWLYKDRYIVSIEGRGVDAKDLERALRKLDVEDLE